jgi:hypothetical protein
MGYLKTTVFLLSAIDLEKRKVQHFNFFKTYLHRLRSFHGKTQEDETEDFERQVFISRTICQVLRGLRGNLAVKAATGKPIAIIHRFGQ